MKSLALLSVVFLLQKCSAFHYRDKFGTSVAYGVTFVSKCRTEAGRFRVMLGIGLPDCVRECGLRPHCEALSYMRQMQMCNLFTTANGGNLDDGDCFSISVTDIKVEKKPCGNCSKGQVCDRRLKDCKYEECLNASITNGVVLGNQKEVGKKIRYKCNHGYRDRHGVESAVCQDNGEWNVTANCTRANPTTTTTTPTTTTTTPTTTTTAPTTNTNTPTTTTTAPTTSTNTPTTTTTAPTTSTTTPTTTTTTPSTTTSTALATTSDCGAPESLPNGEIVLNGGTTYQNTASVTCDAGYQKSVDIISCTASGSWETVTCDQISCGNPPLITNGNIASTTGTMYMDTAAVTCDTSFKANTSTITCTASGSWETAICKDCYIEDVQNYSGTKNITETGYACERWDNHIGKYGIKAKHFPESTLSEIENYCRNPKNKDHGALWCFSTNPNEEWEKCDIPRC